MFYSTMCKSEWEQAGRRHEWYIKTFSICILNQIEKKKSPHRSLSVAIAGFLHDIIVPLFFLKFFFFLQKAKKKRVATSLFNYTTDFYWAGFMSLCWLVSDCRHLTDQWLWSCVWLGKRGIMISERYYDIWKELRYLS